MKNDFLSKLRQVKIFLFDLDGVLYNKDIPEQSFIDIIKSVSMDFKKLDLIFGIITAREEDELVKKLKTIDNCLIFTSSLDKVSSISKFLFSQDADYKNVFYMGDDLLDIPLLKKCGVSCAPENGRREVKRIVSLVTKSNTGDEILNEILSYYKKSKEPLNRATKY